MAGWKAVPPLVVALALAVGPTEGKVVMTKYGPVLGYKDLGKPVNGWKGIPFAAAPVGDLRWRAPEDPPTWTEDKPCLVDPKWCPQNLHYTDGKPTGFDGDEDCLTLNVFAPSNATHESKLPVLFFIHGGSFRTGDSSGDSNGALRDMYDGSNLARQNNVVVVSTNYRMGIFGFLALEALRKERSDGGTGNYGIMDQRKAMRWTQENIAAFGGDPTRVLMFGESAGGVSICVHYVSKASAGLFSAALGESPLCGNVATFQPLKIALNWGEMLVTRSGCAGKTDVLDCMRGANATNLLLPGSIEPGEHGLPANPDPSTPLPGLLKGDPWMPTIDGTDEGLKGTPVELVKEGNYNDVPMLLGTNHNEGNSFREDFVDWTGISYPITTAKAKKVFRHFMPLMNESSIEATVKLYEPAGPNWNASLALWLRDYYFACPNQYFMQELRKNRAARSSPHLNSMWMYMFNRTFDSPYFSHFGDAHGFELIWVWDHPLPILITKGKWTPQDKLLSRQMGAFWSSLARSGTVNKPVGCQGCIDWPTFTSQSQAEPGEYMVFEAQPGLRTQKGLYTPFCDFWAEYGYQYPNFTGTHRHHF